MVRRAVCGLVRRAVCGMVRRAVADAVAATLLARPLGLGDPATGRLLAGH
jgi:hypothetical protein